MASRRTCLYMIFFPDVYKFINDDILYDRSFYEGYEYDDMDRRILRYPKGYLQRWVEENDDY